MMVALQRRLDNFSDGDKERRFFAHVLRCLTTAGGLRVELKNWMVTSYKVEFGVGIFDPIALVLHRLHHLGTEYRHAVLANRR